MSGAVEYEYDEITIILGIYFPLYYFKGKICFFFSGEHDVSDEYETQTFITKANPLEIVVPRRFYIRPGQGTIIYDVAILVMENPVDFTNPRLRHIRYYII